MLRNHSALLHRAQITADLALIAGAALLSNLVQELSRLSLAQSAFVVPDPRVDVAGLAGQVLVMWLSWLVFTDRFDFYRSRRTQTLATISWSVVETWVVSLGVAVVIGSVVWGRHAFSVPALFMLGLGGIGALKLGMLSALQHLRSRGANYRRFLVVGDGAGAERLAAESASNQRFGMQPVGHVPFPGTGDQTPGLALVGEYGDLRSCIARENVDCVVVCPPERATVGDIENVFRTCDEAGIPCQYLPAYLNVKNLHMRTGWWGELPLLYFASQPYAPLKHGTKRVIDVICSAFALLLLSPALIAIAIAIRLGDSGPVFHRQVRVGRHGRMFQILKFRTMHVDAEAMRRSIEHLNEEDGPAFKVKNDPRITTVGRWLRRYSFDELPQLVNVLKGDMSLVGPRPPIPEEVAKYDWWQRRRIAVRPGLTCIWQVWGRNKVPFRRWMEMDLYYVDHWSLWMDIKLMLRTLAVVLRGTGS